MSTKFRETITTRYGEPEKDIYHQVIDLVKKNSIPKSRAQLLLIERGLQHTHNPEPIIKEKVVYKDRVKEVPKVVEKVVYKSPPKVDKSTPQGHVGIQEHITDEHITGDLQNAGQRSSATKLAPRDKADPPSSPSTALEKKKVAKEENGISGWVALGLLGVGLFTWLAYRFTK